MGCVVPGCVGQTQGRVQRRDGGAARNILIDLIAFSLEGQGFLTVEQVTKQGQRLRAAQADGSRDS